MADLTTDTAPDAGHAAETMSNEDLIYRFAQACARNSLANRDIYERLKAELMKRLNHTAPARTAGTETVE